MRGVKFSGERLDHVNIKSRHDALLADLKMKSVHQFCFYVAMTSSPSLCHNVTVSDKEDVTESQICYIWGLYGGS